MIGEPSRSPAITERPEGSSILGARFEEAFLFASRIHAGQTKKGGTVPYISHLMGVAGLVLEAGGDEEVAIAALLHDAVEDCGGRPMLVEIERRFGHRVAHIVDGCSDSYGEPKPLWRTRKENYIQRLRGEDEDVRLLSAADKLHNSRSILVDFGEIGESLWQRFRGGREGTLWYYRALLDELKRGRSNRMVRELERVVVEIENRAAAVNVQPLPTRE